MTPSTCDALRRGVEKRDLARDGANQTERERRPREQHQHGEHGEETQLTNPAPLPRRLRASTKPQDVKSSPRGREMPLRT